MNTFITIFKLGVKYLHRYRRRYIFLLAVLIFGFTIVTFITSTKDGMYNNAYFSAQSHYAGDIVAVGYNSEFAQDYAHHLGEYEISTILMSVELSGIDPQYTVLRTIFGSNSILHFNGFSIQLKNLIGCDWDNESHIFDKMTFEEIPESDFGDDGIIISEPIARQLGAKMGDRLILEVETRFYQKNTGQFIVRGIVRDSSIFGYYKAYISRLSLNQLALYNDIDCSTIGFFLKDPASAEKKRTVLQTFLSDELQTGPLVYDREGLDRERNTSWDGTLVFLYTMPVYLSEVADLLDAMNIITYFIYGMMLIIILVSATVTYRLILHERAREMGIMRVIGFYGGDIRLVLWTEIIILGLISIIAGFSLARLLSLAVSFLSFSWFPGFEIFLKNERLIATYEINSTLINITSIFIILIMMSFVPSFLVSRKNLPALLAGEPI